MIGILCKAPETASLIDIKQMESMVDRNGPLQDLQGSETPSIEVPN
jgi:hypothetical protein